MNYFYCTDVQVPYFVGWNSPELCLTRRHTKKEYQEHSFSVCRFTREVTLVWAVLATFCSDQLCLCFYVAYHCWLEPSFSLVEACHNARSSLRGWYGFLYLRMVTDQFWHLQSWCWKVFKTSSGSCPSMSITVKHFKLCLYRWNYGYTLLGCSMHPRIQCSPLVVCARGTGNNCGVRFFMRRIRLQVKFNTCQPRRVKADIRYTNQIEAIKLKSIIRTEFSVNVSTVNGLQRQPSFVRPFSAASCLVENKGSAEIAVSMIAVLVDSRVTERCQKGQWVRQLRLTHRSGRGSSNLEISSQMQAFWT